MALYLAERYLPGVTREQIQAAAARARDTAVRMTEEGTAVRYLGSTFILEDEACFCLFDAASAETVKGPTSGQRSLSTGSSRPCTCPQRN